MNGYTRQDIRSTVKLKGAVTADELGRELGISPVAARSHLTALAAEGHIAITVERRGQGRPVHLYSLTPAGDETFPRSYDNLALALIETLRDMQGDAAVDSLLAALAEKMRALYTPRMENKDLSSRISELTDIMEENGCMPTVFEEDGNWRIISHNCPVCRVSRSHPSICDNHAKLIKDLLGKNAVVGQICKISDGDKWCEFVVREIC